jgi:ABC-type phosphate transport system auxiliary subunit
MSSNYNLQTDLNEAKAMVAGLEDYVRGSELYGHANGNFFSNMPSLTLGALLMRLRRLDALRSKMRDSQSKELDKVVDEWHAIREEWRLHYEEKLKREADARLDGMRSFFTECEENKQNCLNNYRPELLRRTVVQEILHELDSLKIEAEAIKRKAMATDAKFHSYMGESDFQWSNDLQSVYPKGEYWWLYQKPVVEENKK